MFLKLVFRLLSLVVLVHTQYFYAAAAKESAESIFCCCPVGMSNAMAQQKPVVIAVKEQVVVPAAVALSTAHLMLKPVAPIVPKRVVGHFAIIKFTKQTGCEQKKWEELTGHVKQLQVAMTQQSVAHNPKEVLGKLMPFFSDQDVSGEINVGKKSKHKRSKEITFAADTVALIMQNLKSLDERSIAMEHVNDLPNLLKGLKEHPASKEFYQEQLSEVFESIAQNLKQNKISANVALEVQ